MAQTVDAVLKRFREAENRKTPWWDKAKDALAAIGQECDLMNQAAEMDLDDDVFDSTGGNALDDFVSNIQSSLFPPVKHWISLASGFAVKQDNKQESDRKLAEIALVMFSALGLSNFDTEMASALYDYALGVGALIVNKGTVENPFHFTSVPIEELYIEAGPLGKVGAKFRKYEIELRNIRETWPDATLSQALEGALAETPDKKITVVEALIPEKITAYRRGSSDPVEADGFCYYVIADKDKAQLVKRDLESDPWVVWRWPGRPKRLYPKGPLLKARPDINTLNKVKELLLKKGSRDLHGLYTTTDEGILNMDNIQFGGTTFIPVESNGGARGESIKPLPPAGDMGALANFLFSDLQTGIRKTLFAEPLGPVDAPVKTATEVAYRQAELARKIGAAFGRLQYELMIPLVNRLLVILEELGLIDLDGYRVDGRVINVQYMSPLALAQDFEELNNSKEFVADVMGIYGPQVGMVMAPPDRFIAYWAKKRHLPEGLIPTPEELQPVKEMIMQQGVQQGMMQQAAAEAGGMA